MALDTTSFGAYVRSLNLTEPVNTRPGRLIDGPPADVLELALHFGLGPMLFDQRQIRDLLQRLGLRPDLLKMAGHKLRSRGEWLPVLEALARPHIAEAEQSVLRGDRTTAIKRIKSALTILFLALSGDGYYFYTPMGERGRLLPTTRRLYRLLRSMLGARTERMSFKHVFGRSAGLLHLPPDSATARAHSIPALVAFHPLGGDKDSFDGFLGHFQEAGYATLSLDLPAHGESFDGPRLRPELEALGVAAIESLARHPAIDPERLGVMGGSLGAYAAHRTAAASPRVKACLAYASPFDLGYLVDQVLPGVADAFAWTVGANVATDVIDAARQFHLRDVLDQVSCPVCIVHGTQDHICDFTASYEIASRLKGPVTVVPIEGADHEASNPATPELAQPGIAWLRTTL